MAKEDVSTMNLIQKLAKIREISDVVSKDKRGYNYTYADITSILANITAGMKKYRVSLIPSIVPGTSSVQQNIIVETKFNKTGDAYEKRTCEMLVCMEMTFTWVDDDNPEDRIVVPWFAVGSQTDPSQAFGSALTYTTRYFLTDYFQIAQTDNDVDAYRSKQKEAEVKEDRNVAEQIIAEVDRRIRAFLSDHQDKADEVKKLVTRFVKSGNYNTIKDPQLAAKLLEDFNKQFLS